MISILYISVVCTIQPLRHGKKLSQQSPHTEIAMRLILNLDKAKQNNNTTHLNGELKKAGKLIIGPALVDPKQKENTGSNMTLQQLASSPALRFAVHGLIERTSGSIQISVIKSRPDLSHFHLHPATYSLLSAFVFLSISMQIRLGPPPGPEGRET